MKSWRRIYYSFLHAAPGATPLARWPVDRLNAYTMHMRIQGKAVPKNKSDTNKKKKKSSQLVIRIEASERDAFVKLCDDLDTSAAREIRRFMREWVEKHRPPVEAEPAPEAAPAPVATETPSTGTPSEAVPAAKPKSARRKRAEPVEASA